MKKLFSILLAVAMLCTMSISAFAADVTTTDPTSQDLKVKYVAGSGKHDAYAASITWESMEFTYTSGGQTWDTTNMKWVDSTDGTWSSSTVTIANKSSQGISVTFKYESAEDNKGVDGYWVKDPGNTGGDETKVTNENTAIINIAPATEGENGGNGRARTVTRTITPSGTYTGKNTDEAVKVGTITIVLS